MDGRPGAYAQRDLDLVARRRGRPRLRAEEPEVFAALQARIDGLLDDSRPARILNAGCGGGERYIPVAQRRTVVGIDVEPADGDGGEDIDERLVGDIERYDFGARRFDVVYCWDVLEHLADPRRALANLASTLDPGGLMVLGFPHAASVKGWITRLTPHRLHGWLWRHVLHPGAAHEGGVAPFPTVMARAMTPQAVGAFAAEHGLSVELLSEYEAWPQKKIRVMLRLTGRGFALISAGVRALSFGRVTATATDVVVLLRRL